MSLCVQNVSFSYGARAVLSGLDFRADDGRLVALLGSNGAGKTTLLRCVLGLEKRYEGAILIDGEDARGLSARALARRVAYIPQTHAVALGYTALDMVLMGAAHDLPPFASPRTREREKALAALGRLHADGLADKRFACLSGGEKQLVLIARALAQSARLLLMDEPTASLDYGHQALVLARMRALAEEGYTVLFSTHDPQQALWYADDALALFDGRAAAFGAPRDVIDEALLRRLYGVNVTLIDTRGGTLIAPQPRER